MAITKITTNSLADSAVTTAKIADASVTSAKLASSISIGTLTITSGISGNVAFDTNTLFVDATNNRVGVGTITPTVALDVVGAIKATTNLTAGVFAVDGATGGISSVGGSNPSLDLRSSGSNSANAGTINFSTVGGAESFSQVFNAANNNFYFIYGGTTVGSVTSTGWGFGVTAFDNSATVDIRSTTEQLRIGYDASNYLSATVSIAGLVTLTATGASAGVVLASPVTATAQPALSALTDTHAITRSLFDQLLMDPSILYLRDEFIAVMDNVNPFGELGWSFVNILGSGTLRPWNDTTAFGVAGLHTGAAFRNSINAQFDVSNVAGGGGFIFDNGLNNSSTTIKTRIEVTSINGSFKFGFQAWSFNSFKSSRFFGLRYALPATAWTATNAITLNEFRRPTVANGRRYYASLAGTTGGSEPTWPTASGGTVVDGTVTWTENGVDGNANILLQDCPNTADETTSTFVNTGIVAAANTWYEVVISFVSGRTWAFYINGVFVGNLTMSAINSANAVLPVYSIETSTASAIQLSMDYFFMLSRGIRRPA